MAVDAELNVGMSKSLRGAVCAPAGYGVAHRSKKYVSKMTHGFFITINSTRQVTRATHARNRVCPRVELILKIIIILLIIFLGFIKTKSKPC